MLWRKAWLELRFRILLAVGVSLYILATLFTVTPEADRDEKTWKLFLVLYGGLMLPITAKILAGAGINSQTSWGMLRGFHPSMGFLLAMPVSRLRLLATRVAAGGGALVAIGSATFVGLFLLGPRFGIHLSLSDRWPALINMFVVSALFYCLAVLLSALLDEFWSGTVGLTILGAAAGYSFGHPGVWFDMFGYLTRPPSAFPYPQTLASLGVSALLLLAANWVVNRKEY